MHMFSFKGGIYPPERKEYTCNSVIADAFPSTKQVTIPVTMGGSPNECVVNIGDRVIKGQVIAKSDKYMSAPVHASVTGTVKKIMPHMVTGNTEAQCITVEADGSDETAYMHVLDPFTCDAKTALARIQDAGIVGMGGASFPCHVKLAPPADAKIDYMIINAAECEPYLTVDYRMLKEAADKVVDGLAIEMHILGNVKGIIALESNKLDALETVNAAIAKSPFASNIEVRVLKTKYPQGGEKNLIKALLGREVPSGGLPAATGCIISNVGTACAISDAFRLGKPLVERAFTVSGGACENPMNVRTPIGTNVGDLIPEVIRLKSGETAKIISGGPMMGFAMTNAMFPITKGTSGILFLSRKETYLGKEMPCINCGRCIDACPLALTPVMMARTITAHDLSASTQYGLMDCIECGSCAYVCPAHVQLVQRFRRGKSMVRAAKAASGGM
ncbi:MAG: electron transport complex subunit RsxC [Treponema sp.]|nr:electron transport complex subunit RsxC [Treponema sp.]